MMAVFIILAVLSLLSAVGVVAFKNPINSALCLVVNLLVAAAFFATLEAHFLAAVQVIVYAGAIMVLVLFILMLLNIKVEKRTTRENVLTGVSILVGLAFLAVVVPWGHEAFKTFSPEMNPMHGAAVEGTVEAIGKKLFTDYIVLFQASGLLLMTAIVGAVMLAKRRYRLAK